MIDTYSSHLRGLHVHVSGLTLTTKVAEVHHTLYIRVVLNADFKILEHLSGKCKQYYTATPLHNVAVAGIYPLLNCLFEYQLVTWLTLPSRQSQVRTYYQ